MPNKIEGIVWDTPHPDEITWDAAPAAATTPPQDYQRKPATWGEVIQGAPYRAVAGMTDLLLNTPVNVYNLGKAAYGTAVTAAGRPDLAPELTPNFTPVTKALQTTGAVGYPQLSDKELSTGQRIADVGLQSAVMGGISPVQSGRQLLSNMLTSGALGTTAQGVSEISGSPVAGQVTALTAGLAAPSVLRAGKSTLEAMKTEPAPTHAELKTAATAAYTRAKESGATFDLKTLAPNLQEQMVKEGYNPRIHSKLNDVMGELSDLSASSVKGEPVSTTQINNFYKILNKSIKGTDDERRIAGMIADQFDAAIYSLNPQVASDLIQGRDLWARLSKSRQIESVVKKAERSTQQTSEAIKKGFTGLKTTGYTPEEQATIQQLSKGSPTTNILGLVGKLAPTGNLAGSTRALLLEQAAQHAFLSPATAVALGVGGLSARGVANALSVAKANELAAAIRRGATLEPYSNFNFANQTQTNALRP